MLWRNRHLMKEFLDNSYLFGANAPFIEELYALYLQNPASVSDDWRRFFEQVQTQSTAGHQDIDHQVIRKTVASETRRRPATSGGVDYSQLVAAVESKQVSVLQLINAYRFRGHQKADLDPLHLRELPPILELDPSFHQLNEVDMDTVFNTGSLVGPEQAPLRDIVKLLEQTYCGHIGAEYMHITGTLQKRWIQERIESIRAQSNLDNQARLQILQRVVAAEGLERYLHSRYVGQKRFSLEGGESLIPMLDEIIQRSGTQGISEVVMGMAHRGRLNVLVNILGKSPETLFQEFEGKFDPTTNQGSGDVKYHQGFSCDVGANGNTVHVTLAFNPSHLEIVYPVVEGSVRARQTRRRDRQSNQVLPVVIHGDAAFAGQGVVMETLNMSQARGFRTGGTIHIIINNQIGFTTSHPMDARSTHYCTEVARMVQAPILHVNGDNPEAVILATRIALDFRMEFNRDVVIDMICYRRHGHSEADEPTVTQPVMYKKIKAHPTIVTLYGNRLMEEGLISGEEITQMQEQYRNALDQGKPVVRNLQSNVTNPLVIDWRPYLDTDWTYPVNTALDPAVIAELSEAMCHLPEEFSIHNRVGKIYQERLRMGKGEMPMDWGFAEMLAYTSLLREGFSVRLSGQDSGRGTFFHRHAVLHDQATGDSYVPLKNISENQPPFVVIDSLLSEEAVLAFEYGYSSADPRTLVIWEAQFGDFANNAQVVIDQFISSGEAKWGRLSGLVMMLPHGYDGQGPEHSSARMERYLHICAEENIQVCVPTLPAQMFHMMRRQMLRPFRKPLVIMSPKSLLRHKDSVSTIEDLAQGGFQSVIGEIDPIDADNVKRVVVCSGKIFFDLLQERRKRKLDDVALVRIEQLYPFPDKELVQELKAYARAKKIVWCQEEPRNQGAWRYIQKPLADCLLPSQTLLYAGRSESASPAVGYYVIHVEQQNALIDEALTI